jgi:hypothetical protein
VLIKIGCGFPIIPLEFHLAILHRSSGNHESAPNR